ncbi:aminoacyl-tRNA hydrolase [Szabonella alba]|uniref:Peptidyl-tRNA hydrolase n=1 Tax=Szabonella alba TaxID=2804194 RepID=A0A8K0Y263_9RHOB|nr:aminoacyl-tRNA hydrolase [Szabonella alba]MBL4918812.1 aminoacyl-tRNA hydrolase [Szabonella alba]
MKLIVGLGNPGAAYAGNRHNIGFMALDRIAADHGFSPWKSAFRGKTSEGRLGAEKVLLLKPETFMNLSGDAVRAAMDWHKLTPADVIVLHDELDLAPGKLRLKQGGGHAGHNGLRSIHAHIGEAYGRVRLGIGHPGHKDAVARYVLQDFAKADADWLDALLQGVSEGAVALASGDGPRFTNAVGLRMTPERETRGGDGGTGKPKGGARPAPRPARPEGSGPVKDGSGKDGHAKASLAKADPGPDGPAAKAAPPSPAAQEAEAPPSALQKLMDRFRR